MVFIELNELSVGIQFIAGHGIDGGGYPISIDDFDKLVNEIERLELPYLLISDLEE
ncbi:MAG: hypothetical protein ACKVIR_07370 [Candidatus Poseidoniales archaeon]